MDQRVVTVGLMVVAVVLGSGPVAAVGAVGAAPTPDGSAAGSVAEDSLGEFGVPHNETHSNDTDTNETSTNETVGDNETSTNETADNETATNETADNDSVSAGVGRQLSTVLTLTGEDVREDVSNASLVARFQQANESERAALLAARATTLSGQADEIASEYQNVTTAYENGNVSKGEYAHRLALLNARSNTVENGLERVQRLAEDVSTLELTAAGYESSTVESALQRMDTVSGPGANALLNQFSNGTNSSVGIQTKGGFSVSVASEDGSSREFERAGDNSTNLTVSQSTALSTAREALSSVNGTWTLTGSSVDTEEGTYSFTFDLSAENASGEASVTVDGSSGTVIEFEEEIEIETRRGPPAGVPGEGPGASGNESDGNESAGEGRSPPAGVPGQAGDDLSLLLDSGTPAPNGTVTVALFDGAAAVAGETVTLNGEPVGTTDANGTVTVTLPTSGEAILRATTNGSEATLTFGLGEDAAAEIEDGLDATGSVDNGTVTITVTYEDEGVPGVTATVNGSRVGTTGPDGTLSFTASEGPLVVEITKGQFDATLSFDVSNSSVTLTGADTGGDDRGEGRGNGAGAGAGSGNSNGNGSNGNGAGAGAGNGNGNGNGAGTGNGNGNGSGAGAGNGNGQNGSGTNESDGNSGNGSGAGSGNGSGDGSSAGSGNGAGGGNGDGSNAGSGNGNGSENGSGNGDGESDDGGSGNGGNGGNGNSGNGGNGNSGNGGNGDGDDGDNGNGAGGQGSVAIVW